MAKYRILTSTRKGGQKFFYPQRKIAGTFWRTLRWSNAYDTWKYECDTEYDAMQAINEHKAAVAKRTVVAETIKEIN